MYFSDLSHPKRGGPKYTLYKPNIYTYKCLQTLWEHVFEDSIDISLHTLPKCLKVLCKYVFKYGVNIFTRFEISPYLEKW